MSKKFGSRFERDLPGGGVTSTTRTFLDEPAAWQDARFAKYALNLGRPEAHAYVDTYENGKLLDTDEVR